MDFRSWVRINITSIIYKSTYEIFFHFSKNKNPWQKDLREYYSKVLEKVLRQLKRLLIHLIRKNCEDSTDCVVKKPIKSMNDNCLLGVIIQLELKEALEIGPIQDAMLRNVVIQNIFIYLFFRSLNRIRKQPRKIDGGTLHQNSNASTV